jgi:hypothetical protein
VAGVVFAGVVLPGFVLAEDEPQADTPATSASPVAINIHPRRRRVSI